MLQTNNNNNNNDNNNNNNVQGLLNSWWNFPQKVTHTLNIFNFKRTREE